MQMLFQIEPAKNGFYYLKGVVRCETAVEVYEFMMKTELHDYSHTPFEDIRKLVGEIILDDREHSDIAVWFSGMSSEQDKESFVSHEICVGELCKDKSKLEEAKKLLEEYFENFSYQRDYVQVIQEGC